jgi:uncharacterized protein (TIGR03437 family)
MAKLKFKENVGSGVMSLSERYWLLPNGELIYLPGLTSQQITGPLTAAWISTEERSLFTVSPAGLMRRDLITHTQSELIPQIPVTAAYASFGVPGSVMQLPVLRVTNATAVTLSGRRLMTLVEPTGMVYAQIPWDITPGIHRLEFELKDVAFEAPSIEMTIYEWQPAPLPATEWTNYFTRGVRAERFPFRPPRPGELADLYVSGLGRVENPPLYGEATPADMPRPVLRKVEATLREQVTGRTIPLEVVSAKLAPGLIGSYVVQVRLPRAENLSVPFGQASVPVTLEIGPAGEKGTTLMGFSLMVR